MFKFKTKQVTPASKKGFTLLELLIVIAILAILGTVLVLVLNPAETLKKSRDTQRISDLSTLKTAIGLYVTQTTSPTLGSNCLSGATNTAKVYYSSVEAAPTCAQAPASGSDTGATFSALSSCSTVATATAATAVDGNGWVPVNLGSLTGGSPISNLPLDPTNTSVTATPTNADLVYRYVCQATGASGKPSNVFELDAVLESDYYKPSGTDDKSAKDGGDNANYYEVGTSLRLLGTGTNF